MNRSGMWRVPPQGDRANCKRTRAIEVATQRLTTTIGPIHDPIFANPEAKKLKPCHNCAAFFS
jgi:hypothetical protein